MSAAQDPARPSSYPPSETALLLLDFHHLFVQYVQPQEVQDNLVSTVQQLMAEARRNSVPIVHGLVDFKGQPPITSKLTERWNEEYKPMMAKTPELAEEFAAFREPGTYEKEHTVLRVPGVISAQKSEDLLDLMRNKYGVKSVVICGISTHGAVLSAARDAADLGFVTTVVGDGCWDPSLEVHRTVLDTILAHSVWVVGLDEGLSLLQGQK